MRILVVEDDFGSRRLMQKLLEIYGDVDIVIDGEEAIDAFKLAWEENKPYGIIFMHIMMPKIDGQQALQAIRKIERSIGIASLDEVKVVMTTVLEDPKNVFEAFRTGGATSYLVKPIDREKLKQEMLKLQIKPKE